MKKITHVLYNMCGMHRSLDLGCNGCKFETHSGQSLSCVYQQDILFVAKYWFNPGRQEIVPKRLKKCRL